MNIGNLHFLTIHFPIALFIGAAAGQILWSMVSTRPRKDLDRCVQWMVWAGTAGAVVSAGLGYLLVWNETLTANLTRHRNFGTAAAIAAVLFCGLMQTKLEYSVKLWGLIGLAALTSLAAHYGGVSVHGGPLGR